jgi:hypothetical protein
MSARETFRFGQYVLRPAGTIRDLQIARAWTKADPEHAGRVVPGFWLEQTYSRSSWIVVDHFGPLLFFKIILYTQKPTDPGNSWMGAELHMQFAPAESADMRERVRQALTEGLPWVERVLTQNGVSRIFFDSNNPMLVRFSVKRLGFTAEGSRLSKVLLP